MQKVLSKMIPSVWILSVAVFAFFAILFGMNQEKEDVFVQKEKKMSEQGFSLNSLKQGTLSLTKFKRKIAFPDLTREVILLAKNLRPGSGKGKCILSLQSSGEEYKAENGEQIFLSSDALAGSSVPIYYFSHKKTPLWIKPVFFEEGEAYLEIGLFKPSKESESFQEEKIQVVLREKNANFYEKKMPVFIESLQKAKLWGQDVILSRLAEKKASLKDKLKLEIPGQKTVFCLVNKGDLLCWEGGNWVPALSVEGCDKKPLARVKTALPRLVELDVWDEEGFCLIPIKLDAQVVPKLSISPSLYPRLLHVTSAKRVSCSFGKKHFLLKEGDWVLKTAKGFRHLRSVLDRENYVNHRLQGELFVFDALVKDQGKVVMKGFFVDEMRTQMQPFAAAVLGDNKIQEGLQSEKKQLFFEKSSKNVVAYFSSLDQAGEQDE
jgi:hypothetical protein